MTQLRLIIAGVLALVIVGMVGTIYKFRGDAIAAKAEAARFLVERDTAVAISDQKDVEINRLVKQTKITNDVLLAVSKDIAAINANTEQATQRLTELESTNDKVRVFLDTPLPDGLSRLLNSR